MASAPLVGSAGAAAAESAVAAAFLELLPENEYLLSSDPTCMHTLLQATNTAYAFGHKLMTTLLSCLLLIFAPFVGIAAAAWSVMASIARQAANQFGRAISDELGYGEYVRTKAAYTAWQRAGLRPRLPSPLPVAGVRPSSRETPLKERELGWFTEASQASWVVLPVRYFNAAFSAGFMFGVVILSAVICILSPIVGMFVSFFSFGYSLLRSFQRADGRLMTDILGVSELVDQEVAHMKEQMQLAPPVPAAAAGAPIIAAAAGASYGSGGSSTGGAGAIPVPLSHAAFSTRTDMGAAYTMLATGAYGAAVPHALPAGAAAPAQGYMPPAPMPGHGHGPAHGYESAGGKAVVNPMGAAMASASAASAAASLPTDPTAHSGGFYPQVGGTYH